MDCWSALPTYWDRPLPLVWPGLPDRAETCTPSGCTAISAPRKGATNARASTTTLAAEIGQMGSPDHDGVVRLLGREAVGKFPGSDEFLCRNDKESMLRGVISVSEAPQRPSATLL
jgi:hypothetical protein